MKSKYILHIDIDYPFPKKWLNIWKKERTKMLKNMGYTVEKIIIKKSPSKKAYHAWIHLQTPEKLSDEQINLLNWLSGDCQTRVWINILRINRGLRKYWSKLFTRHLWKKPLPKHCRECRLRKILYEMRKKHEEKKEMAKYDSQTSKKENC